jgi:hypothetical protein
VLCSNRAKEFPLILVFFHPQRHTKHCEDTRRKRFALITAPQKKVTITPERHSRMLLAGIQKKAWMPAFAGMTGLYLTPVLVELYLESSITRC